MQTGNWFRHRAFTMMVIERLPCRWIQAHLEVSSAWRGIRHLVQALRDHQASGRDTKPQKQRNPDMSLLEAMLLDPYRINVWIAYRTDGGAGSGTQNDPYDGSTNLAAPVTISGFTNS